IIMDSDEDVEVTGTHAPITGLGRVNHSICRTAQKMRSVYHHLYRTLTEYLIRIAERERKKQMGGSMDCLQYLILMLDTRIVNSGGHGVAIFMACEALGIQYITKEQTVPFSITWNRQVTSINVSRENQVETVKSEHMEEDVLVLLPVAYFVNFVQNHKKCGSELEGGPTLTSYVQTVKQHLPNSILSFVVIGMEKYFRDQKTKVQRKHRAAVLSSERVTPCTDSDHGSVHRLDVEEYNYWK
ncbi:uncharacterized protein LOC128165114, partial [Crassostrea angulata]|uniref:uncharacterized protein LOC128165114 n=1 Tax=Magallana angulata TaxID=2784310 RepID=UPI0022B0E1DE